MAVPDGPVQLSPLVPLEDPSGPWSGIQFPNDLWPFNVEKKRYLINDFKVSLSGAHSDFMVDYWLQTTRDNYGDSWPAIKNQLQIDGYLFWGRVSTKLALQVNDFLVAGIQFDPAVNQTHVALVTQEDYFNLATPRFTTYRNITQVYGVTTQLMKFDDALKVECSLEVTDCSGLQMVYGNRLDRRNETAMEWNFWLWMKGPEASAESGFRLDQELNINIWVGEYQDQTDWFWAYGNFTAIAQAASLPTLVAAFSLALTPLIL